MKINFTKMHGIGNDYIYINCMSGIGFDPSKLAIAMSPRHHSVGADGVVLICASDRADAMMRMFNADGSEGKMCGNAIRCVGKYLYDNKITDKREITVDTLSGVKKLTLHVCEKCDKVTSVTVDMGYAVFDPAKIPVLFDGEMINEELCASGMTVRATAVSMGNPHSVIYCDDPKSLELEKIGPSFENHPIFPERVNTEFVRIIGRDEVEMRVWERGSGETWACGTGACAVVASSVKNGLCDANTPVTVHLVGGDLKITCTEDYRITMEGGATKVYDGVYEG